MERDWLLLETLLAGLAEMAAAGTAWATSTVITDWVLIVRVCAATATDGDLTPRRLGWAAETLAELGLSYGALGTASFNGEEPGLLALCAK
ncbi:hypothetical protein [Paenibacillus tepidiphilus]|uniref:hypothetical protein n=1 Tax=Paenibacillus tepidiphilus TaxID=2608683 RepID=UPI00123AC1EA|nr:hypothetical protein [Paenibacillus tepidiphilus]